MEKSLKDLQRKVIDFRDARGWHPLPKDQALSLMLEAAELLEQFQWRTDEEFKKDMKGGKREKVEDEMADILYWIFEMAHDLEIDLSAAFERKMKKNLARYPVDKAKEASYDTKSTGNLRRRRAKKHSKSRVYFA